MRLLSLTVASILGSLTSTLLYAQSTLNYAATELPRPEWPQEIQMADMNGDGLLDLIVPLWSSDTGRQLHIYWQQADQRYPPQPSRVIDIRSEIVAVALADIRPEPGDELLLITGSTVFSLSSAMDGYSGNLRRLFDWPLSAAIPNAQITRFLPRPTDNNGDGFVDLLLPGADSYGWFTGAEDEQFTLSHQFSTVNTEVDESDLPPPAGRFATNISFNAQDGLLVDVQVRSGSLFEDFLQQASNGNDADNRSLLEIDRWMPAAIMAPMSQAGAHDLVYLNIGNDLFGQVNIVTMSADGGFSAQPDWQAPVEMRGDFLLMDFNGDGLQDIVRVQEDGSNWSVSFFGNRGFGSKESSNESGPFDFNRADQVMRFSGYDLRLSAMPILGNTPQLSVSYYTIPVVNAVRDASIVRTTLLFNRSSGQGVFNSRPDFLLEESFSASTVRGLSSPIVFDADLNADGRRDALYLTPEGTLAAKTIDDNLRLAATPFWQHVPTRSITGFTVRDLNGDGRPDLILDHSNTVTVLVSAP